MKIVDYHIHSDNSFDGKSTIDEMCKSAINLGLHEICFTEHFSVDPKDVSFGVLSFSRYSKEIDEAIIKYSEAIVIKKGLEIGEPHLKEYEKKLKDSIKTFDLDFIIGSIHNINSEKIRVFMKNKTKYEIYKNYFEEVLKMVEVSDIDSLGHMDLVKRYAFKEFGNYDFNEYKEIITKILKKIINRSIALEVNTSGISDGVNEVYPKVEVLELYKELGGNLITIGSDSHIYKNVSKNTLQIRDTLREIGFNSLCIFNKRRRFSIFL